MRAVTRSAALLLAVLFGISAAACTAQPQVTSGDSSSKTKTKKGSTSDDEDEEDEDETPKKSSPKTTPEPDPSEPTPPPTEPTPSTPPPNAQCAQEQDPDSCIMCCEGGNQQATAAADQAFEQCACGGSCASACGGSFCRNGQPSAACEQCLANTCEQQWQSACNADPTCAQIDACVKSSCKLDQQQGF